MNNTNDLDKDEEISLFELWNIFKNHFAYFLLTVLIVLGVAFLYLQKTIPTYSTNVTVLVDPIKSSSSLTDVLSMNPESSEIATEVMLIKSEKDIQDALDSMDLSLYRNSFNESYDSFYSVSNAIANLTASYTTDTNLVTITAVNENPQFAADLANAVAHSYDNLLTGIAKNSKTVQKEFLEKQIPLNELQLKEASNKLSDYREASGIMQLNEKAASLVNQIAFFDVNKEPLTLNKKSNNEVLKKYKEELCSYSIAVPDVEILGSEADFKTLTKTYITANDKLLMYNLAYSSELGNKTANSTTISSKTGLLTNTINNTSNKMLDYINKELIPYRTDNAYTNKLLSEYGKLVLDIMKTDIELTALDSRSQIYNNELNQLPIIERQVTELTRNVTVLQQVGLELKIMLEKTKLTEAAVSGNVTVIDKAKVPTSPVSPNRLLIMAVALLLGIALGFLVCIVLNLRNTAINTRDDLKAILGERYKLLGWLPLVEFEKLSKKELRLIKKAKKNKTYKEDEKLNTTSIPTCDNPTSLQSEKYMNITSNIIYGNFLPINKVITITSCDISAGKSSIIANIGMCLAKMGSKVIIIDGDFRMPSSLTTFGFSQAKKGCVEVIMGKSRLEDVIVQPMEDIPNFNILPVGHKPQLPSAILAHPYFNKMMEILKDNFDYVLIDTPPLNYGSEVLALAKLSDSIILTARAGITSKNAFKDLIESLSPVGEKIIGAILNGFIPSSSDSGGSNSSNYGYGKKYGYGYGYGYGYSASGNRYSEYSNTNSKTLKKYKLSSQGSALRKENRLYMKNLKNRGLKISTANKLHNTPPIAKSLDFGEEANILYEEIKSNFIIKNTKLHVSKSNCEQKQGAKNYTEMIKELKKDKNSTGKEKDKA
jgi:capsular exopolysaccharide synthesis family protein